MFVRVCVCVRVYVRQCASVCVRVRVRVRVPVFVSVHVYVRAPERTRRMYHYYNMYGEKIGETDTIAVRHICYAASFAVSHCPAPIKKKILLRTRHTVNLLYTCIVSYRTICVLLRSAFSGIKKKKKKKRRLQECREKQTVYYVMGFQHDACDTDIHIISTVERPNDHFCDFGVLIKIDEKILKNTRFDQVTNNCIFSSKIQILFE